MKITRKSQVLILHSESNVVQREMYIMRKVSANMFLLTTVLNPHGLGYLLYIKLELRCMRY